MDGRREGRIKWILIPGGGAGGDRLDGTHQGSHPGIRVGEGEDLLVKAQTLTIQIWTHPHSTLIWGGLWGPPHHPRFPLFILFLLWADHGPN